MFVLDGVLLPFTYHSPSLEPLFQFPNRITTCLADPFRSFIYGELCAPQTPPSSSRILDAAVGSADARTGRRIAAIHAPQPNAGTVAPVPEP